MLVHVSPSLVDLAVPGVSFYLWYYLAKALIEPGKCLDKLALHIPIFGYKGKGIYLCITCACIYINLGKQRCVCSTSGFHG